MRLAMAMLVVLGNVYGQHIAQGAPSDGRERFLLDDRPYPC
jgi:hypothetical protein